MKSNKLLYIRELYLNLPDDFTGTVLDALKLLVEIREDAEKTGILRSFDVVEGEETRDLLSELWDDDTRRCSMNVRFLVFNWETNEWESQTRKI